MNGLLPFEETRQAPRPVSIGRCRGMGVRIEAEAFFLLRPQDSCNAVTRLLRPVLMVRLSVMLTGKDLDARSPLYVGEGSEMFHGEDSRPKPVEFCA